MTQRRNPFAGTPATPVAATPQPLYETLRVAEKRTRNRKWEQEHLPCKAIYRGVDPHLALQVKKLAAKLLVPTGEVARALLEYALRAYAEGDLDLTPRPNPQGLRMTLYPQEETREEKRRRGGMPPGKKKAEPKEGWRVIVTWRGLPPELKQEIAVLSSGEGLLKLEPVERVVGYSLYAGVS